MKNVKLFLAMSMMCVLSACASDEVGTTTNVSNSVNKEQIKRDCEQHHANTSNLYERGKQIKSCIRSRGGL